MTLDDVITVCQEWSKLGWAVQAQLVEHVLDGDLEDANPNALKMMKQFFAFVADNAEGEAKTEAADQLERIDDHLRALIA